MHDLVDGLHALQERRARCRVPWGRPDWLGALDVGALEDVLGVVQAELVADRGHVGGHRAVAEGDEHLGPLADLVDHLQVVLVADGAFDQAQVHVLGVFLDVHDRAEDEIHLAGRVR